MDKLLTISIAAYNVEQYIEKNLQSIIKSKFLDQIDIIVVNDGSSDKTDEIVQKYTKQYAQSIRLISKKNGGYGSTINESIKIAQGKYFRLLDGDDWLDSDELDKFIECIIGCNVDLLLSPFYKVSEQTGEKMKVSLNKTSSELLKYEKLYKITEIINKINIFMHGFTFKTDIFRKNPQLLTENCFYTDNEYIFFHLNDVHTIYLVDCYVYCYRVGLNEQSISIKGYQKHYRDHIKVIDSLIGYYNQNEHKMAPEVSEAYQSRITELICIQYKIIMNMEHKRIKEMLRFNKHLQQVSTYFYNRSSKRKFVKMIRGTRGLCMGLLKYIIKFD